MSDTAQPSRSIFVHSTVRNLWRWRHLAKTMTDADLRDTHANRSLGSLWWLLDPILMTFVYTLVIVVIRGRTSSIPAYPVFVMCGIMAWKQFSYSLQRCSLAMFQNRNLISTFLFPRAIIPFATVSSSVFLFCVSLVILCAATALCEYGLQIEGVQLGVHLLLVPVIIFVQFILALGASLLVSCMGVFFKDLSNLLTHVLRVGWFLSPGLYLVDYIVPGYKGFFGSDWTHLRTWYLLNPFVHIMGALRDIVMFNRAPDWGGLAYCTALGLTLCWVGLSVFRKYERIFAKHS
ncbi:MAG: ABC transporter permease [Planctomycetota bacterium]|jgi:ABC-type polysaccharide/polyol phosphate export permease